MDNIKKIRVFVSIGADTLAVPIDSHLKVKDLKQEIENRINNTSSSFSSSYHLHQQQQQPISIIEIRLQSKQGPCIDDGEILQEILREDELIFAIPSVEGIPVVQPLSYSAPTLPSPSPPSSPPSPAPLSSPSPLLSQPVPQAVPAHLDMGTPTKPVAATITATATAAVPTVAPATPSSDRHSLRSSSHSISNTLPSADPEMGERCQLTCQLIDGTTLILNTIPSITMTQLKHQITSLFSINPQSHVVDLFLFQHPMFVTKESASLSLQDWHINPQTLLFVNFRKKYLPNDEFYHPSNIYLNPFQYCEYWQPLQADQSPAGMACFLSSLFTFVSHLTLKKRVQDQVLGHFSRMIQYPPAVLALYYLFRRRHIVNEFKGVLSNAFFYIFRQLVPSTVKDSNVFEHSHLCVGFLILSSSKKDSVFVSFQEVMLTCAFSHVRMQDPCSINGNPEIYDRSTINEQAKLAQQHQHQQQQQLHQHQPQQQQPQQHQHQPQQQQQPPAQPQQAVDSKFGNITSVVPQPHMTHYLLCHPDAIEIYLISTAPSNRPPSPSKLTSAFKNVKFLNIVGTLSLKRSFFPCLTLNSEKNVCVCTGAEPCAVHTLVFFDTLTGNSMKVDPDILAMDLFTKQLHIDGIDGREITEAIVVCFDVSNSMGGPSFKDMRDNTTTTVALMEDTPLSQEEVKKMTGQLESSPHLEKLRLLYRKSPKLKKQVLQEIQKMNAGFTQILRDSPQTILHVLKPKLPTVKPVNPSEEEERIQLSVVMLNGETLSLDQKISHTIEKVKTVVNNKLGRSPNFKFQLSYANKVLEDEYQLSYLEVLHGDSDKSNMNNSDNNKTKTLSNSNTSNTTTTNNNVLYEIPSVTLKFKDNRMEVENFYTLNVPASATAEELIYSLWSYTQAPPSTFSLWKDLKLGGDGMKSGTLVHGSTSITDGYKLKEGQLLEIFKKHKNRETWLTRLETLKELFQCFINRMEAYCYSTCIGLILFGSDVKEVCKITPLFEVFRSQISKLTVSGDTCLFDAICKASESLFQFSQSRPDLRMRILCLSDGKDTGSESKPWKIAQLLQHRKTVLDAIMIDRGADNPELTAIAKATGGYAFTPITLKEALNILELETVLCSQQRPSIDPRSITKIHSEADFLHLKKLLPDLCNEESFPPRKFPEQLNKSSHSLLSCLDKLARGLDGKPVKNRPRQIIHQIKQLMAHPHPCFDVFPSVQDFNFWTVVVEGPAATPYEGGAWLCYLIFPENYPQEAPEFRFVTPIKHCNISHYGKVCHSIFLRNWVSDTSISQLLSCVYGLFFIPEMDDALDTNLAMLYYTNSDRYVDVVKQHVKKHATSKTRQQLVNELPNETEFVEIIMSRFASLADSWSSSSSTTTTSTTTTSTTTTASVTSNSSIFSTPIATTSTTTSASSSTATTTTSVTSTSGATQQESKGIISALFDRFQQDKK